MITKTDEKYLIRCVELATLGLEKGDQPFGSVLVSEDGTILFEDHNHVASGDHTQHPEFNIARWSGQNMTEEERAAATVYTSGEHCPMCSAAHGLAGLGRIVYASSSVQLNEWLDEFGVERKSKTRGLSIEEVLIDPIVDGPFEGLSEKIKDLHKKYYQVN